MFNIVENHKTVHTRHRTLSAARDALAEIRKAALKKGLLATFYGSDCVHIGQRGESGIVKTFNILEG